MPPDTHRANPRPTPNDIAGGATVDAQRGGMGNKKAIFGYVAAIAAICWFTLAGYQGQKSNGMVSYTSSEYGFTLQYPSSWQVANSNDATRREKQAAEHVKGGAVNAVDVEVFSVSRNVGGRTIGRLSVRFSPFSPDEYMEKSLEFIRNRMSDIKVTVIEPVQIRSVHGTTYEFVFYESDFGKVRVKTIAYATAVDGGSLLFGLTAVEDQYLDSLEKLFKTVRFESHSANAD
jgi:hypothetical protein